MKNSAKSRWNTSSPQPTKIYLRVIVRLNDNEIPLTLDEHRQAPCNFIKTLRYEERLLEIQFTPGSPLTTKDLMINVCMQAYARKYDIVKYSELTFDPKIIQ